MPNCFSLTRRSNMEAGPVSLATIDEEICSAIGDTPHPVRYARGWFDSIGWILATRDGGFPTVRTALEPCVRLDHNTYGEPLSPPQCAVHTVGWCRKTEDADKYDTCPQGGWAESRERLLPILDYLEANYTPNAWAQIGKR